MVATANSPEMPMFCKTLLLALLSLQSAAFAAKSYGYLRVTAAKASIYHGAADNSAVEASASKGEVYTLLADKLIHGFYKIDYSDHVSYIAAGDVVILDVKGTPVPTPKATAVGTSESEDDEDVQAEETPVKGTSDKEKGSKPKLTPTPQPKKMLTPNSGLKGGMAGDGEEVKRTPTVKPTPKQDKEHEDGGDDEGEGGHKTPTRVPTLVPTDEATEIPTAVPTPVPTRIPTALPTQVPTRIPTRVPTPVYTVAPTLVPTAVPTAVPTRIPWPTMVPTPVPTPSPPRARGRRTTPAPQPAPVSNTHRERRSSRVELGSTVSVGSQIFSAMRIERPAGKLNDVELHLPLGWGKHETLVQPPFKQTPGLGDQRPIEFGGFAGLGVEWRSAPWLRWDLDWTAFSHRTKAADLNIPATSVHLPGGPPTALFDMSEAYYRMNTHAFRLGVKGSLPLGRVEPWLSASYGAWLWSAELSDLNRAITYGEDSGLEWGGSLGVGVDFHGDFSNGMGWTITPFVEWGAPQVNPTFKDVAGLGVDWKDDFGAPVAIPARAGIQFGIGF